MQRALDLLKGAKRPLILLGKGAAYAQADADIRALVEKTGIPYLPMSMAKGLLPDTHELSASAARSYVLPEADVVMLVGARLNWLLSHGKGKTWGGKDHKAWGGRSSSRSTSRRPRSTATWPSMRRWSATSAPACRRCWPAWAPTGPSRRPSGPARSPSARTRTSPRWPRRWPRIPSPMNFHSALDVVRDIVKAHPDAMLVNEGANTLDFTRSIVDMYKPRKRLDVGTWGIMGIGMGFAVAAAVEYRQAGDRHRRRQRLRLQRHGGRDHLPLQPAGLRGRLQQQRRLPRHRQVNLGGGADVAPTVFVKGARYDKMMEAFGGVGVHATTPAELRSGHGTRPSRSRKPTLINAVIDETAGTESGRITSLNPTSSRQEEVTAHPEHSPKQGAYDMSDKPLEGIKIIDFTHVQAGPACTQMLAWFGADVIKVERPGSGDVTRSQLRDIPDADALYFTMLNSNKRSLTLDTKKPEGKAVLEKLIKESDVMVENFGPGALDRMGFTWEHIQELNPGMILASVKGFSDGHHYEDLKVYENVAQCAGGAASTTGYWKGENPARPSRPPRWATPTPACTWPSAS